MQNRIFSRYIVRLQLLVAVLLLLPLGVRSAELSTNSALVNSTQLVLVTTDDWNAVPGRLQRYARKDVQSAWKREGSSIPVVVGRSGLGWGRGIHPAIDAAGPQKKEGDGRSPAGIFRLGDAFGLAPGAELHGLKLPYLQLNPDIECVDDVKSVHYNSIVGGDVRPKDWDSSEHMKNVGAQYRLGVVVEHNFDPRVNGGGSCIFMHIWKDSGTGTSGCTAMSSEKMDGFITWLDPHAKPLLVQLPKAQYKLLRKQWQLP